MGKFEKILVKNHLQKIGAGNREVIRNNTVPRAGNSRAPDIPGLGNSPNYRTPEEYRVGHLTEAMTRQPAHPDPEGRKPMTQL